MRLPWEPRRRVEVLSRDGCGLCARAEALAAREARGHEIVRVDVDADRELQRRHHVRVPVTVVDGIEVAQGGLEPGLLRRALRDPAAHALDRTGGRA